MWKLSRFLLCSSTRPIEANAIRCLAHKVGNHGAQKQRSYFKAKQTNLPTVVPTSVTQIKPLAVTTLGKAPKKAGEKGRNTNYKGKRNAAGKYGDAGIRNRLNKDTIAIDPFDTDPEAFEDRDEFDVFKSDKLYDDHHKDKAAMREFIKYKTVERKYFKTPTDKHLSHDEREHIRYLHSTDPEMWTHQMLAEHFAITIGEAKKITKSKWISYNKEDIQQDDCHLPLNFEKPLPLLEQQSSLNPKVSRKYITLKELQKKTGVKNQEPPHTKPDHCDTNELEKELTSELFLQDIPKWANTNKDLRHEENESMKSEHNSKDGAGVKMSDDLYQKGDSFYSQDGEFLYRVPVLSEK